MGFACSCLCQSLILLVDFLSLPLDQELFLNSLSSSFYAQSLAQAWTSLINIPFSSVQFSSVAQSCPTVYDPTNRMTWGLPVHHQLPEVTQTHILRVSDVIQPSHSLSSPSPPVPSPSQHQSKVIQKTPSGIYLVVQWLILCTSNAGGMSWFLIRELRSYIFWHGQKLNKLKKKTLAV